MKRQINKPDPNGFVKDEETGLVTNTNIHDYHEAVRKRRARQKEAEQEAMMHRLRSDLDMAMERIKALEEQVNK